MNLLRMLIVLFGSLAVVQAAERGELTPDFQQRFMKKNSMSPEVFAKFLPYIHPPVEAPVAGGVSLDVPEGLGNQELAAIGIVDVTAAPFAADASGRADCTQVIQKAVDFARDHQMILYFPPGKYLISDTIECRQMLSARGTGLLTGARNYPCVLVGSSIPGKRSVLMLAANSPGFTDPAQRKMAVHVINCNFGYASRDLKDQEVDPLTPQANINYSQVFADIDIVIGEGNNGAVGIRMQAAEGSTIQNVTIDATHGHTGMLGAAGSGGSHHNITIRGGRIGIDTHGFPPEFREESTGTQPTPTLSHVRLIGQTEAALVNKSRGPLIAVGWEIVSSIKGPVIRIEKPYSINAYDCGFAFIDSVARFEGPGVGGTLIAAEKSFYLKNVHIHQVGTIAAGIDGDPTGWLNVAELAYPVQPAAFKGTQLVEPIYLNGKRKLKPYVQVKPGGPPQSSLQSQHIWDESFPSWQSPQAANVKAPAYGAVGDSLADDTAALQKAIDENEIVFLPKGYYRVTDTLRLKPNTKLVGVAHHLSTIMARPPFGALGSGDGPKPLVETADAADADTALAFIGISVAPEAPDDVITRHGGFVPLYALHWRCGGTSLVRSPSISRTNLHGHSARKLPGSGKFSYKHPLVRISGNGGGRWYNFFIHGTQEEDEDYRHILVDGITGPLRFYHLHAQNADSFAQCEFRDSRDVTIYGVKAEYQTRFLVARNMDALHIHGHSGNATAMRDSAHYLFFDCRDLLVSNMSDKFDLRQTKPKKRRYDKYPIEPYTAYAPFIVEEQGRKTVIPCLERPVLWKSGQ